MIVDLVPSENLAVNAPQHFIVLRGDWSFGAMYVGAIILAYEIFLVGGGAFSLDYWLSRRLATRREGHS